MTEDDLEPIDLEPIDLEPIDLEPADLEPVDHEAVDKEWRLEQLRIRRRVWIFWGALAGIGLAVWAVISVATRDAGKPSKAASATSADRVTGLVSELRAGLEGLGSGRFAAVIDDRLYIIDESNPRPTLVPLPEGRAVIKDQNVQSLLVSTFDDTLVSTLPVATRTLSVHDNAIRAVAPATWWLARSDGNLRTDHGGRLARVPAGTRVVAAVRDGFVAVDPPGFGWVLRSGATTRPIAPAGFQLLTTGPRTVVFKHGCGYNSCLVEILDLAHRTSSEILFPVIPQFAAWSPDGRLLALASTQGDVFILGPDLRVRVPGSDTQSVSLPFAWTPDSRSLIVVGTHDVRIVRSSDGFATRVIARTDGLQQLLVIP